MLNLDFKDSMFKCLFCKGFLEIIGNLNFIEKKVKCTSCGFSNHEIKQHEPEVFIRRKRD